MEFVVCGEALIDLIPGDGVASAAPGTEPNRWRTTGWTATSGGGPFNTAVALARLGRTVQFMGRLGSDSFAHQLEQHLVTNGVLIDHAVRTSEPTSLAIVDVDEQGHAHYTFHFSGTANFGWRVDEFTAPSEGRWLHMGSIAAIIAPGAPAVLELVRQWEGPVSFDVNVRPSVISDRTDYWKRVEPYLMAVGESAGIIKASDEDIAFLAGVQVCDKQAVERAALEWARLYRPGLVVVTLGAEGAIGVRPDGGTQRVPGHRVEVADTVGAGDTFMAGFLDAYSQDPSLVAAALARGTAAAAVVCTRVGADPPSADELPTR